MENYKPQIAKNVIETLSLGMYKNAHCIYREYVQNARDQIDIAVEEGILDKKSDGKINIFIDKGNKSISIEDNATGIKTSEVLKFLVDVANSQKDRTNRKGFSGIGHLGGLGYCEKLIFETSYKGENTNNTITLNAKQLKQIIENKADTSDASIVLSIITSLDKRKCEEEEHYFKVTLENVTNDGLLNQKSVKNYLSMVAPVLFNKDFIFSKKIHNYFNENNVIIEEYDVCFSINKENLFRAYKIDIFDNKNKSSSKILDINFFKIKTENKELIAIGWYGISDLFSKKIHSHNIERGFRIRKDNIQIGSKDTLNRFFKEARFNYHFIGEIHVLGNSFIPNARRDYFIENKTVQTFETNLKEVFYDLSKLVHSSSAIHNRLKKIEEYENEKLESKQILSKLNEREKKIVLDIYTIIEKNLKNSNDIEKLKKKIGEYYK